ncbi:MAG: CcmD family protein [Gemmatimonadetes bacterium]|nr:CcmD family protein [Gemmatimonadota bacterium]
MSFVLAAYAVLWLVIFGYLVWLAARVRSLREETRSLAADATPWPRSAEADGLSLPLPQEQAHPLEPPIRRR